MGLVRGWPRPPARETEAERQPPISPVPTDGAPVAPSRPTPPQPGEARQAIERVFAGALALDRREPSGVVSGDFNADGSPDLAVAVRPREERLQAINDPLANWTLEDPRRVPSLPGSAESPVRVEAGDALLAVVHGHGPAGWRNPEARQAYLLKDAAGRGMRPQATARILDAAPSKARRPAGDAIVESLDGRQGFLYWTGARYAWHDLPPRTSREHVER